MNSSTENRNKIESIFFGALNLESAEAIEAYLEDACSGDEAIRREVEELLAAKSRSDSFVDRPVDLGVTTSSPITEGEGSEIGRYKLLQKLGEGGFGLVFMAEQTTPVTRKVALKIVKPGMDSREVIARFEAERQALAMMDHPNIAKVLDAGTTDTGRPYFVMELVKGISITEYCDTNNLPTKERLNLFMQVCRAVQHAHQKGIIHRDLKPSNVMVTLHDGVAVPKVIDFGVSKALSQKLTEKTLFTRYGQIVGTPQYMSPEQAEMSGLDVDTRSDIYSLGVLLYELLTGRPPFDAETLREAGFDGMRRMIREEEPIKPSNCLRTLDKDTATMVASHRSVRPETLHRSVAGDLDWIVMKSLEKDRNRRYETANGLLRDIERHLGSEAVHAGPPSFGYQLRKLYQRHRAAAVTAGSIGVVVVLALLMTSTALLQAKHSRDVAVRAREQAEQQRQVAEKSRIEAVESGARASDAAAQSQLQAGIARQTTQLIAGLLTSSAPNSSHGKDALVSDLLNLFQNQLETNQPANPEVELEARLLLASAYRNFSQRSAALSQLQRAEQIATGLPYGNVERVEFLVKLAKLKSSIHWRNKTDHHLRKALEMCRTANEPAATASVLTELGKSLVRQDSVDESEKVLLEACAICENLAQENVGADSNPFRVVSRLYYKQGRLGDALPYAERSVQYAVQYFNCAETISCHVEVSRVAHAVGKVEVARHHAEAAIRIIEDDDSATSVGIAKALNQWAEVLDDADVATHRSAARRAMACIERLWPKMVQSGGGNTLGRTAGALAVCGDDSEADSAMLLAGQLPDIQKRDALAQYGETLLNHGYLQRANDKLREVVSLQAGKSFDDSEWGKVNLARTRYLARDFLTARQLLDQACVESEASLASEKRWINFEAALLEPQLEDARVRFLKVLNSDNDASSDVWDGSSLRLISLLRCKGIEPRDEVIELETAIASQDPAERTALGEAALAELAVARRDLELAKKHYVAALEKRRGRKEYLYLEWINEAVVKLFVESNDIARLEVLLAEDVDRRDRQVSEIHPERAFVRMRLADVLIKHDRDLKEAKTLLVEAKKVYDYHGDWIPEVEHRKLDELLAAATVKTEQDAEATP